MARTNKERELWQKVTELLEKPLMSTKELNGVIDMWWDALEKKERQLKRLKESRDKKDIIIKKLKEEKK